MDETYNLKAIVLKRSDFRENDSLITIYSRERGKLDLVVRGAKKATSKLSAHIEVLNEVELMVVVGKNLNYVGGTKSVNCFGRIKQDFSKLQIVGEAIRIFDKAIKPEFQDVDVFALLESFLLIVNQGEISFLLKSSIDSNDFSEYQLVLYIFLLKLLALLGYRPEVDVCVVCKGRVADEEIRFNYLIGGLVCGQHLKNSIIISKNTIKFIRLILAEDLDRLRKYKIEEDVAQELIIFVKTFIKYQNII